MINLISSAWLTTPFRSCLGSHIARGHLRFPIALGLAFASGGWGSAVAQTKTPSNTVLAVTSGTSLGPVSSITSGSVITLTATVTAGSTPLTFGQVNFCIATAKSCTDIHLLGLAQLTSAGTAVMKFRPGPGSHQYKAIFAGTTKYAGSASATATLDVTGPTPTTTLLSETGIIPNYTVTGATIYGNGTSAPSGLVSFLDISNNDSVLVSATLAQGAAGPNLLTLPNPPSIGCGSRAIAIGDFNGDGIEDLASGGFGTPCSQTPAVAVFPGNGDGTFGTPASFSTSTDPTAFAVGDFNHDGILDLAVAYSSSNSLTILLGKGDGTFTASQTNPTVGTSPEWIAVADFNGDGILDLAVVNNGSNDITVLLGNGDGTFTRVASNLQTGSAPYFIAVADFNEDGIPDLAVLNNNNGTDTLTIFLGNGAGGFALVTTGPGTGSFANALAVADLNGDGIPDLALLDTVSAPNLSTTTVTVSVLIGTGDGTFKAGSQLTLPNPTSLAEAVSVSMADFNTDGIPDLAVAMSNGGNQLYSGRVVTILLGDGKGNFSNPGITASVGESPSPVEVADLNGDGTPDLAISVTNDPFTTVLLTMLNVNQSASVTVSAISTPPATGTSQVVASYGGDSKYLPSTSAAFTLTAPQGPSKVSVTVSSNPAAYGTSETLTASVTGSGLTPTGSVTFYDGAGQLGTQTLTNGVATFVTAAFTVGSHSITVSYGGDSNYTASTSAALPLVVKKGPPTIGITLSPPSILTTQALQVGITVSGAAGNPTPQGSVTASSGGYTSTSTSLSSAGTATITIPAGSLSAGSDTLTVTYTPSTASGSSYTSTTQSAAVTVVLIGTGVATVTVAPSPSAVTDQQADNVKVTVAGAKSAAAPTGSIVLAGGGYSAQMTLSGGSVTFAIAAGALSAGTDTLTATYSGDGTYAAASGTATVTSSPVVIGATAPSPIAPGASATAKVTLTAGSSYSGTLNLTCALTTSPANAQSPPTCALDPATDTIAADGNATTTLTVNTTAGTSQMGRSSDRIWDPGAGVAAFAALLMIGLGVRRRRWLSMVALSVMAICLATVGCGGSSHSITQSTSATSAGTYVFTVKAADSKNTSITTSASVSVTVQ